MSNNLKKLGISESFIIFLIGAVQFIDIWDFMMVMPLGPDFAKELGIAESMLGYTAGSYMLAAAISGIVASKFLDRFERKFALITAMLGLVISTALGAFAWSFETLLVARFIAGFFGGPATAISLAIISDIFPEKERGKAMGKVMGAFSLAAIFGVPLSLEISRYFNWHASFLAVSFVGFSVILLTYKFLPKISLHLEQQEDNKNISYLSLLFNKKYLYGYLMGFFGLMGAFIIIPYISAHLMKNLHFPRENIGTLYFIGGAISFFLMRIVGKLIDKSYSYKAMLYSLALLLFFFLNGYFFQNPLNLSLYLIFPCFMIGLSIRNIAYKILVSKIPKVTEKAGFMSIISCYEHIASATGSFLASIILVDTGSELRYIEVAALIAIVAFTLSILIAYYIETKIIKSLSC